MIRFLIRFVSRVIRFFWRLFWRTFWTLAIAFMIFVGYIYFLSGSNQQGNQSVRNALDTAVQQLTRFTSSSDLGNAGQHITQALSDDHSDHVSGVRWNQASATVYIDPNINDTFKQAYQEAIDNWNQTGAFTFTIVDNERQADIVTTEMNDSNVSAAGEAQSQTNLLTNRFMSVNVRLNSYYLLNPRYGYSYDRIVNTAEHELGHAIGLDHNESLSVMQSAGSFYSIQPQDIAAVQALYQE